MAEDDDYIWTRRDAETHVAYEAFRVYLKVRSVRLTCEELGKSLDLITRWSARHQWVARVTAYDQYIGRQDTDSHVEELTKVRHKQLKVAEKLLDHLDRRLDEFIVKNQDPSIRWTQAFVAGTKAQLAATQIRDVQAELGGRIEEVMTKLERLQGGS